MDSIKRSFVTGVNVKLKTHAALLAFSSLIAATACAAAADYEVLPSKFDGKTYRGSSDISMPRGIMLPQGTWSVDVMFRDGTTITKSFEVSYDDDFDIPDTDSGPVFDSGSNLTFLP